MLPGGYSISHTDMQGRETEENWLLREKTVIRIRGMLRGGAAKKYPDAFATGVRASLEGIVKTVCRLLDELIYQLMSLRTTVSQQACATIQELAEHLKSGFDPCVEGLLPSLGKMAYVNCGEHD
jgi:CLIP-associating protein 1/2